ncbi:hypothetical protein KC19_9G036600, partial [Ceratodon purpureus]
LAGIKQCCRFRRCLPAAAACGADTTTTFVSQGDCDGMLIVSRSHGFRSFVGTNNELNCAIVSRFKGRFFTFYSRLFGFMRGRIERRGRP